MKNIILKIHPVTLFIIYMSPVLLFIIFKLLHWELPFISKILIIEITPILFAAIWTVSVSDFMDKQSKEGKTFYALLIFFLLELTLIISEIYIREVIYQYEEWMMELYLLRLILVILIGITMIANIRKVFYERTSWFIF